MARRFEESMVLPRWVKVLTITMVTAGLLFVVGIFAYGIYQQVYLGKPWGKQPMSDEKLVWFGVGMTLVMAAMDVPIIFLVLTMRQVVRITSTDLVIDAPFAGRKIKLRDIAEWEVKKASGYGVHYTPRRGWRINLGAKQCVHIQTRTGKSVAVGTCKPEAFIAALEERDGGEQ